MLHKADVNKVSAHLKSLAYRNPGDGILLETGAKLYYLKGRGYFVSGYHNHDALPYIKNEEDNK